MQKNWAWASTGVKYGPVVCPDMVDMALNQVRGCEKRRDRHIGGKYSQGLKVRKENKKHGIDFDSWHARLSRCCWCESDKGKRMAFSLDTLSFKDFTAHRSTIWTGSTPETGEGKGSQSFGWRHAGLNLVLWIFIKCLLYSWQHPDYSVIMSYTEALTHSIIKKKNEIFWLINEFHFTSLITLSSEQNLNFQNKHRNQDGYEE